MVSRLMSALLRAVLVALMIATPSLLLPTTGNDTAQLAIILAFLASILTFIEYYGQYPSIIEFRFAAPVNRIKFAGLWVIVVVVSLVMRGQFDPIGWTVALSNLGELIAYLMDFKYSPISMSVAMLPRGADPDLIAALRVMAGLSYAIGLMMVLFFVGTVWLTGWPTREQAFNVWVNLPLFDPTCGGDVLSRLKRDASLNILLGIFLPLFIPITIHAVSKISAPLSLENPQTVVWIVTGWAFVPASLMMRGIAMLRVAELIHQKRRRANAKLQADGLFSV